MTRKLIDWEAVRYWFRFVWNAHRSPLSYRRLFRRMSSCCLTPSSPGKATIAGVVTTCITTSRQMIMTLDGAGIYYVDRDALTARIGTLDHDFQLWECPQLNRVLKEMIRRGVPYETSDPNIAYARL